MRAQPLSLFETDGDLRNLGSRRHDRHRLVVAARGQGEIGRNAGRLRDGLDLTAFAGRAAGNSAGHASGRFLKRAGYGAGLVSDVRTQVEIVAVAGAPQPY